MKFELRDQSYKESVLVTYYNGKITRLVSLHTARKHEPGWVVRKLLGDNLKVVWTEFSALS